MIRELLIGSIAVLGLSVPATAQQEFPVPPGARVTVTNHDGDIVIRAGSGREGWAELDGDEDEDGIAVRRSGDAIRIEPRYGDGGDMFVTLPGDVSLEIVGVDGDVTVSGFSSSIVVETFDGEVNIEGALVVAVRSIDGDVWVRDVDEAVTIDAGDGDVDVQEVRGPVTVNGIDGDIVIRDADARAVNVSTISGNLWYDGRVYDGGAYRLGTHDGDVTFAVPQGVGATISVLTYDGALLPSFPLQMRGSTGSIAEFTLGDGSAKVQLESFDGNIHLIRPGERSPDH